MPLDGSEFTFEIDETTKLLIAARELVERGWCQGALAIGDRVCAIGAITRNALGRAASLGTLDNAMRRLEVAVGRDIPPWNDMPERTQADILNAYDIAIASV